MQQSVFDRALAVVGLCRRSQLDKADAVTEQLQRNAGELHHAQMRHRAILQAMPDLMFVQTPAGVYLDYYARNSHELLVPPSQFIGRSMRDVLPPDVFSGFEACFREAAASGGPAVHDYTLMIGGSVEHFEARAVLCEDGNILSVVRNMTGQKRAEQRLSAAQAELMRHWRLMGFAELASSFARDMGQPLTAIVTNAQAALRWLASDRVEADQMRDVLTDISSDGERAAAMIRQTREMFSWRTCEISQVSINGIVHDAALIARTRLERVRAATRLDLDPAVPAVLGDRVQLQQVVLQLIVNAADALSTLTDGELRSVAIGTCARGRCVHVSVADNGPGVDADGAARIFEPLYTTKDDGIGMGLTVSRSIVEAHGGKLWLADNLPRGAAFHFTLPVGGSDHATPCTFPKA